MTRAERWARRSQAVDLLRTLLATDRSTRHLNTAALAERLYVRGVRVRTPKQKRGA